MVPLHDCIKDPKQTYERMAAKIQWVCSKKCKQYIYQGIFETQEKFFNKINLSISELTKNVEYHNELYSDMRKELDQYKSSVDHISDTNQSMRNEIQRLKMDVNTLQQDKLQTKAIGFGIKYTPGKNTLEIVKQQLSASKILITDIIGCQRLYGKPSRATTNSENNNRTKTANIPPIILTFTNGAARDDFLKQTKTVDKPEAASNGKFWFKELLTSNNKKLLDATNAALNGKAKFIWSSKGNIYVRANEKDKHTTRIRTPMDIQNFLEALSSSGQASSKK